MMANISSLFGLYLFAILLFLSGVNNSLANNAPENIPRAAPTKKTSDEDGLELAIQSVMRAMEDGFARTAREVGELQEEMKSSKEELRNAVNTITSSVRNSVNKATVCPTESVIPPANCYEIQKRGQSSSGVYSVIISGKKIQVYCDMTTNGGGWTMIHRRTDTASADFNRRWADYKTGFGDLNGEFWLGLDNIHGLTSDPSTPMGLRIDLEDWAGEKRVALYSNFMVSGEEEKYKLNVGGYEKGPGGEDPGDSLAYYHNGWGFSTKDHDNDGWSGGSCAQKYYGGWWYASCLHSKLTGVYLRGTNDRYEEGVIWYYWKGKYYSLKRAAMMIRPR